MLLKHKVVAGHAWIYWTAPVRRAQNVPACSVNHGGSSSDWTVGGDTVARLDLRDELHFLSEPQTLIKSHQINFGGVGGGIADTKVSVHTVCEGKQQLN